jgi:hypothetical protein
LLQSKDVAIGAVCALYASEVRKETVEMKKRYLAVATLFLTSTALTFAFEPQRNGRNGNQSQQQQAGQQNGKRTGPQDGSGPIHTPGTGGCTGAGQRRGRS